MSNNHSRGNEGDDQDHRHPHPSPHKAFFQDFSDHAGLSPAVRRHLAAMYGHLAVTAFMALFACWLQINGVVSGGGILPAIGGVGALWSLRSIQSSHYRQVVLYTFGFLEGLGIAPVVDSLYYFQPQTLLSALATTLFIFVGFSTTALLSSRRSYLYLGGLVSAGMVVLLSATVLGLFFQSHLVDSAVIYLGLLLFSLLVTFDTQLVVERVEGGRFAADPIMDAANMLVNVVAILRRVLVIMADQQAGRRERSRSRSDHRKRQ